MGVLSDALLAVYALRTTVIGAGGSGGTAPMPGTPGCAAVIFGAETGAIAPERVAVRRAQV